MARFIKRSQMGDNELLDGSHIGIFGLQLALLISTAWWNSNPWSLDFGSEYDDHKTIGSGAG